MGKFIPVEPEKWAEMVKAQAEVARLEAEVERLTSDIQMEKENEDRLVREWQKANNEVYGLQRQVAALIDDQTRLKAECQARQAENSVLAVECDSLKAEVERLTKAGDYLACHISIVSGNRHFDARDEWLRAKKGFPSIQEQWKIEQRNRDAEEAAKKGGQP